MTAAESPHELIGWRARWTVDKFHDGAESPYETIIVDHNLLMYGGASNIWECLIGNGTTTSGQTLTYFSNARAYLGVGTSSTAAAATQTDLQADGVRAAMATSYPTHTDGTTAGSATCTWKSEFGTSVANQAWNEVALFNASSGGRMLNRKVVSLGTKTSSEAWNLTLAITLA